MNPNNRDDAKQDAFGMIVVEIAAVDPKGKGMPRQIDISNDSF